MRLDAINQENIHEKNKGTKMKRKPKRLRADIKDKVNYDTQENLLILLKIGAILFFLYWIFRP